MGDDTTIVFSPLYTKLRQEYTTMYRHMYISFLPPFTQPHCQKKKVIKTKKPEHSYSVSIPILLSQRFILFSTPYDSQDHIPVFLPLFYEIFAWSGFMPSVPYLYPLPHFCCTFYFFSSFLVVSFFISFLFFFFSEGFKSDRFFFLISFLVV